jgi:hypothetical protein
VVLGLAVVRPIEKDYGTLAKRGTKARERARQRVRQRVRVVEMGGRENAR